MKSAVELQEVQKSFGTTRIILGVSLEIREGERHAIIGPNGAGKSTLFNLISGRYEVSAGRILLHGADITNLQPFEINRKGLSRSFQVTNIFHNMSVYENVRCGVLWSAGYRYSFWHRVGGLRDVRQRAEEVMERIGLGRRRNALAGTLTYAEQRALEIGVTIAGGASVILLDEPTAGMSAQETHESISLLARIAQDRGLTLLFTEHDMSVVFRIAQKIAVLHQGRIIASGLPDEVRNNPEVRRVYLGQGH